MKTPPGRTVAGAIRTVGPVSSGVKGSLFCLLFPQDINNDLPQGFICRQLGIEQLADRLDEYHLALRVSDCDRFCFSHGKRLRVGR